MRRRDYAYEVDLLSCSLLIIIFVTLHHSSGKDKAKEDIGIPDEGEFEDNADETPFVYSHGITSAEAARLLLIHGRNELPEKTIPKW